MNKTQSENQVDTGLKHQDQGKPVPDGNKDAFDALLKRACEPRASAPEDETSGQA